ncbi:MAG: class B sortase [Clostridiales Family XIII bacterium]|nr:class B sortase [Clostridiales Family XIII bacterium]
MNKKLSVVLICVCAIVLAISGFKVISYFGENSRAENVYEDIRPPGMSEDAAISASQYEDLLPYYEKLRDQNGHFVGWLSIPGTNVNYPVMQTKQEPEYYLYRDFHQKDAPSGSLFVSELSDVERPSDNVIIYGHRMKTGAMFGNFGKLLEPEYLAEHDLVIFDTFANRNEYQIWCLFTEAVDTGSTNEFKYYNYSDFQGEIDFANFLSQAKSYANIVNPDVSPKYGDKILLLSTCEYSHDNGRLVAVCVRTSPESEEDE